MSQIDFSRARPIMDTAQLEAAEEARLYLEATDWYVIRAFETGTPVPEEVAHRRTQARAVLTL
jgi:hypothetical protein